MFLIPEDIARYIDYSSVSKDECFKLTHDEYESGNIYVGVFDDDCRRMTESLQKTLF